MTEREPAQEGQRCGNCRWRKLRKCQLRSAPGKRRKGGGGLAVGAYDGKTCSLWDPKEGEKYGAELPSPPSMLARAQELPRPEHRADLRALLGEAMRAHGIPTGEEELRGHVIASTAALQAWRREHLEDGEP